jgi:hypothetical protein
MSNAVSIDKIIGVWLKREYRPENWDNFRTRLPNDITQEEMNQMIEEPNYNNQRENIIRFFALDCSRGSLFYDTLNAKWTETTITERDFKKLMVIRDLGWNTISKHSGLLSNVATFLHGNSDLVISRLRSRSISRPDQRATFDNLVNTVRTIRSMEQTPLTQLDKTLFLLKSYDSFHTTILEGNKTAVSLFIKYFILKETEYESPQIFLGQLKTKSRWQR